MIIKRILQVLLACGVIHLFVYGSTKRPTPPAGTPPMMMARPPVAAEPERDATLARVGNIGTNEVWDFSPPGGATVVAKWRKRGAANERVKLGCEHPTDGPISIDTFGRVWTPGRVYSPLGLQVGMVPEPCWTEIGRESLAWWTVTASNSTVVTWMNALLGRDTNTPVSVQAEFFEDGRFAYRYDLSALGVEASNVVARIMTDEGEEAARLEAGVTSVGGRILDAGVLRQIADGVTNETYEVVTDELSSTKLWDEFEFRTDPGTNALYSRTFEVDRRGGWTSCFLSGRGEPWCAGGQDAIGEWSLEGAVIEWSDDTGASGVVAESPRGDSLYLPVATNATRVTIVLRATDREMTASGQQQGLGGRHASPQPVFLLVYSPRLEFPGGQEVTGNDGNAYSVFASVSDFAVSLDTSNRPCLSPIQAGEATAASFAAPSGVGVYTLPACTRTGQDGERYLVVLDPWVTYGTAHYACWHSYPYDWGSLGGWCSCTPEVDSGVEGHEAVNAYIDWFDDDACEGVVEVAGAVVWRGVAYHVVWPCNHEPDEPGNGYCPCGCGEDCEHCNCLNPDGPSQGSIRFRIGLGKDDDGRQAGFVWFESDGPVTVTPLVFEVSARPGAGVAVRRYGSRVEMTADEAGGRNITISGLTNGVLITVGRVAPRPPETEEPSLSGGQGLTALPLHTWEITNVGNSNSVVRLVKKRTGETPVPQGETTSGQQQGSVIEDWTYACRSDGGEWVWDVTDNLAVAPPSPGESVEVIGGTNFVFGADGKLLRLTVETNGEEVVVRTISYDDDGRVVLVDDGTNGYLSVAYDADGTVTNFYCSAWNGNTPPPAPLMTTGPGSPGDTNVVDMSPLDALRHYRNGGGSTVTLYFGKVNTDGLRPIDFAAVKSFVATCHEPGDYPITGTRPVPARGKTRLILGDVTVKVDGWITYTGHCNWTFSGTMQALDDTYDFNAANRGILGETLTAIGRMLFDGKGTPYVFQFSGTEPLTGSGHCGDR